MLSYIVVSQKFKLKLISAKFLLAIISRNEPSITLSTEAEAGVRGAPEAVVTGVTEAGAGGAPEAGVSGVTEDGVNTLARKYTY